METMWVIKAFNKSAFADDGKEYTVQYIFDPPLELPMSRYPDTKDVADYLEAESIPLAKSAKTLPLQKTAFVLAEDEVAG